MITPSELIARYVTPYIRGLIAIELSERGVSQPRIASLLGVSQPMVAKYLRLGRSYMLSRLSQAGLSEEEALTIARSIALRVLEDKLEALTTLAVVELSILARGIPCNLYVKKTGLTEACRILRIHLEPADPVIVEVERAFLELASIRGVEELIPEVGANIVALKPGAKSHLDVVGFPGRIVKLDRGIVAVGKPVYGGSRFMARLLLEISKRWSEARAMISLKWSKEILDTLNRMNVAICNIGPFKGPESYWDELPHYLSKCPSLRVVSDLGGPGLEPIIYIVGRSAIEVVGLVKALIAEILKL